MKNLSAKKPTISRMLLGIACCLLMMAAGLSVAGNENYLAKPPKEWTEQEALKLLNESPWAHTVTTSTQDVACNYLHPVFPDLFNEDEAVTADAENPAHPSVAVKPDGAEYLIRWQSAKPVQAAIQRLIALNGEGSVYGERWLGLEQFHGPTDLDRKYYNLGDMITIAVVLKHPGPDGASFLDYAFNDHGKTFPAYQMHLWPCAGLKTGDGEVFAHAASPAHDAEFQTIQLSFPHLVNGKPLITHPGEEVEFRFVVNQRVFATTFTASPSDLLDGSEDRLYMPSMVTGQRAVAEQ